MRTVSSSSLHLCRTSLILRPSLTHRAPTSIVCMAEPYMLTKLESAEKTWKELSVKLADPDVVSNNSEYQKLVQSMADLDEVDDGRRSYHTQLIPMEDAKDSEKKVAKVPDGFYLIHGMDPFIWTISTDLQETGRVPSLDSSKGCFSSVVLQMGSLSVGFCVHRALLFKLLANMVNLLCRIAKGCKYCGRDFASSCLVRFGNGREYIVDLIGRLGSLSQPDSLLNGTSSIVVSSPLCHPRFRAAESAENLRMLAKLYFLDCQSLHITFDDVSSANLLLLQLHCAHHFKLNDLRFVRNGPVLKNLQIGLVSPKETLNRFC